MYLRERNGTWIASTTDGSTRTRWAAYCGCVSAGIAWPNGSSSGTPTGASSIAAFPERLRRIETDGDDTPLGLHIVALSDGSKARLEVAPFLVALSGRLPR